MAPTIHIIPRQGKNMSSARSPTGQIRAMGVAVGLTISAVAASFLVAVIVLMPIMVLGTEPFSVSVFALALIAGQLGFLVIGIAYVRRYELSVPITRPTAREFLTAVGGSLLALVTAAVMITLLLTFDILPEAAVGEVAELDPRIFLVIAILSILFVAPIEEFVFRGVIQGRLRRSLHPISAIVVASLLFGAIHAPNYLGAPMEILGGVLLISTVGLVFGSIYELTNNLTVPIIMHALYNVVLMMSAYAMV